MAHGPVIASAVLQGGKLQFRNKHFMATALAAMKDGDVLVTIERQRATRSSQANRWYWGVIIHMISEETGYTPEEIHEYCKCRFIPKRIALADSNGEVKDDVVIGGSTTKLDTTGFHEYCEVIRRWAAEDLGLDIPDPQ